MANFEDLIKRGLGAFPGLKKIEELKKVLVVQPHADDADVGIGGTIAKLVDNGCEVTYLTLTDDRCGTSDPSMLPETLVKIRMQEQEEAAKVLGVKEVIWLGYYDSELYPSLELREKIIRVIREKKPEAIFTVDPWLMYEAHPDHRTTGIMAAEAFMFSGLPNVNRKHLEEGLEPHAAEYIAFFVTSKPNTYVDITNYLDKKLEAVKKHKSQFGHAWSFFESYIRYQGRRYGKQINVQYAEAFKVMPGIFLHYNVDASEL
ncbi:MAG: PIG-L deacetylase family protein [Thermoproteota archaeon]|jgi:LmbE family N-acetylglucosaminyl deacetylase